MKRPRMNQRQKARLGRLLNMYYSPSELANEIGCSTDTIYKSFIPAGCPHKRDGKRIWIVGSKFREWILEATRRAPKQPMPEGFAYCLRCKKPTQMVDVKLNPTNVYVEFITGHCAECGARVNRAKARE